MQRRTLIASVGAIMGTGIGATAYTSATVNREATISVATDSTAQIELTAGGFDQITENTTTGVLDINFPSLNSNSTFVFGDSGGPQASHAFTLTHNEADRDVALDYAFTNADPDGTTVNVQFEVFTDDGAGTVASQAVADEDTTGTITSAVSGQTYYVVLTIDTTGVDVSTNDLSGTLTISA